jgi:hypothetical protein
LNNNNNNNDVVFDSRQAARFGQKGAKTGGYTLLLLRVSDYCRAVIKMKYRSKNIAPEITKVSYTLTADGTLIKN